MNGLTSKTVTSSDEISRCTIQLFPKVYKSRANLGLLSRILDKEPYVIILETKSKISLLWFSNIEIYHFLETDDENINIFVGIATPMVLLEYISTN